MQSLLKGLSSLRISRVRDFVLWRMAWRSVTHGLFGWINFAGVVPADTASSGVFQQLVDLYNNIDRQRWTHGESWMAQSTFAQYVGVFFQQPSFARAAGPLKVMRGTDQD